MIEQTELLFHHKEALIFITKKFENNSYQLRFSKSSKQFFDSMYVFVFCRVDEINEKMYDFEANKRNNLIFYGIANETRETQPKLLQKATKLLPDLPHTHSMRMICVKNKLGNINKCWKNRI